MRPGDIWTGSGDQHWETKRNQIGRLFIASSNEDFLLSSRVKIELEHQPAIRSRYFIVDSPSSNRYRSLVNIVWNLETLEK
jgi:hypothetical protein